MTQVQIGYFDLLRENRNFRNLWLGQVVSLFGDWFNLIASAALISDLTESGFAVGGLFIIRMLAPFIVSPIAGVAADRFNRKHLLILTDISRVVVVLGFLFVRDSGDIWLLYLLSAVQLAISGFFFPTRNAILPDIVNTQELGTANALSSATWSVMLALGAALGGFVAGSWGIYPAFVIDSATFLLSAFFIALINYVPDVDLNAVNGSIRTVFAQYIDGLKYLLNKIDVLVVSLQKASLALTINGGFQVVQVILAEQVFVIGEGGGYSLGIMYAVAGIGTGLGPIIARRFTGDRERQLRKAIFISYLICIAGILVLAPLVGFWAVLLGTFLRSIATGINWVFSTQILLQILPANIRGRIFSTEFAFFTLANALGTAAAGWMLDNTQLDLSGLLFLMAVLTAIPAVLWGWWNIREKRAAL